MGDSYIEDLHRIFHASDEAKSLFEWIIKAPAAQRERILKRVDELRTKVGLSYALLALYRQQVNSGFVLADPLKTEGKSEKSFFDADSGVTFRLQWNPHRELRKNHALLIERNVIAENIDQAKLINKDKNGKACYLCKTNIEKQNPGEILLDIDLAGEEFHVGANFAYITNNHFTVMSAAHRPQQYRSELPEIINDFLEKTDGYFRVIFNGLAGATIGWHEHLQATTEPFPIEQIRIGDKDVVYKSKDITVARPYYYIPVWLIEGRDRKKSRIAVDRIIKAWHELNEATHTENMVCAKSGELYRTFIVLRDRDRLVSKDTGKKGAMAAFETGGNIILSYEPAPDINDLNERHTFDNAGLETVKQLLEEISPDEERCRALSEQISSAAGSLFN
ncbi:MAG TPA: DUF4922 domain-containing protein [Sedimentisphaerales bacterium]|nr:DUF4922 domain-containing protein [Sedimentisphaerales bacterium]